jgi:hypothetical protein
VPGSASGLSQQGFDGVGGTGRTRLLPHARRHGLCAHGERLVGEQRLQLARERSRAHV